jgi:hypothetical protein
MCHAYPAGVQRYSDRSVTDTAVYALDICTNPVRKPERPDEDTKKLFSCNQGYVSDPWNSGDTSCQAGSGNCSVDGRLPALDM